MGSFDAANATYRIQWLKYQYTADPLGGSTIYMPEDRLLRKYLRRPEGMLSDIDFHYHGLLPGETKNLTITKDGEDQYRMMFYNIEGARYEFPLLSNRNGIWKYGSDRDDLIFVEGANGSDHNIGINDYFILSNNRGSADADKPVTHILRYLDYDSSTFTLYLESQTDRRILEIPLTPDGIGYIIPGAQTYKVNVSNTSISQPNLSIDLDANGAFGNQVKVVTYGGVIINLAQELYLNDTLNATLTSNISTAVGDGKIISNAAGFNAGTGFVKINAQVLAKKFDTPSTDERFNWTIRQVTNNKIDLTMTSAEYTGPLRTDLSNENTGYIFTQGQTDINHVRGLTDWGIIIDKFQPSDHPAELNMNIPQTQRYTQMFVSVGRVVHGVEPAGVEKVNPIAIGLAILDTEALEHLGHGNIIVIGGPCVNKVAAELLQAQDNCAAGFVPESAIIKSFDLDDKVAILVAGYDGKDTLAASKQLSKYKTAKLSGEEMVVKTAVNK
jgi:hypothetical protein